MPGVGSRLNLHRNQGPIDLDIVGVEDVTTVGGLVYALFGRVPASGEALPHSGFRIVVERVRRRRIERVYFERLAAAGTPGGSDHP